MMLNTLRRVGTQRCSNRGLAFKHPLLNPVFTGDNALKVDNTIIANRVISMVGDNGRRILLIRKPVLANYKRLAKLLVITPTMARKPLLIIKSTGVKSYLFDSNNTIIKENRLI